LGLEIKKKKTKR